MKHPCRNATYVCDYYCCGRILVSQVQSSLVMFFCVNRCSASVHEGLILHIALKYSFQ